MGLDHAARLYHQAFELPAFCAIRWNWATVIVGSDFRHKWQVQTGGHFSQNYVSSLIHCNHVTFVSQSLHLSLSLYRIIASTFASEALLLCPAISPCTPKTKHRTSPTCPVTPQRTTHPTEEARSHGIRIHLKAEAGARHRKTHPAAEPGAHHGEVHLEAQAGSHRREPPSTCSSPLKGNASHHCLPLSQESKCPPTTMLRAHSPRIHSSQAIRSTVSRRMLP